LENEIAVINRLLVSLCRQAFHGGNIGGGFALMTEGISLAAQSETPVLVGTVRDPVRRTSATYSSQADLLFTLNAGHGDFLRFMAAPAMPMRLATGRANFESRLEISDTFYSISGQGFVRKHFRI
jgi:2-oxoglutarate ferredoxin oxidoreductase subunit alpha